MSKRESHTPEARQLLIGVAYAYEEEKYTRVA
jgi:hypothetical protein